MFLLCPSSQERSCLSRRVTSDNLVPPIHQKTQPWAQSTLLVLLSGLHQGHGHRYGAEELPRRGKSRGERGWVFYGHPFVSPVLTPSPVPGPCPLIHFARILGPWAVGKVCICICKQLRACGATGYRMQCVVSDLFKALSPLPSIFWEHLSLRCNGR